MRILFLFFWLCFPKKIELLKKHFIYLQLRSWLQPLEGFHPSSYCKPQTQYEIMNISTKAQCKNVGTAKVPSGLPAGPDGGCAWSWSHCLCWHSPCSPALLTHYPVLSLGPSSVWSWSLMSSIWCSQGADLVLWQNRESALWLRSAICSHNCPHTLPACPIPAHKLICVPEVTAGVTGWKSVHSGAQHAQDQKKKLSWTTR